MGKIIFVAILSILNLFVFVVTSDILCLIIGMWVLATCIKMHHIRQILKKQVPNA